MDGARAVLAELDLYDSEWQIGREVAPESSISREYADPSPNTYSWGPHLSADIFRPNRVIRGDGLPLV